MASRSRCASTLDAPDSIRLAAFDRGVAHELDVAAASAEAASGPRPLTY